MKNHHYPFILLATLFMWMVSCKEPLIDEGIAPFYEPTSVDADGGNWRTIALKSASVIAVSAPASVSSDAYQHELSAVKNALTGVNPDQNTAVTYWAGGGILRWNQLARLLVAKYNGSLEPLDVAGQPGSYDATNPVANAPFAARMFAMLSVAQYDALVVVWRAKYQYNRPSLERQGVLARVPILDVPSYPSEDAAVAEASAQVLAYFFPKEAGMIRAKATEHKQSRLWAGANVASDLKVGEDIAATVAETVLARAKIDRFDLARDPNNTWKTALAKAPYDLKWTSLEIPARLPIAPLAGKVKTWFDSTAILRILPAAPPLTTTTEFKKALAEVRTIADIRTREQSRIAAYWEDGAGTYTPPGHWNLLAEDLIRQGSQNELRAARTYALMNRAMQDAATACWLTKYTYFVPRPSQVDPVIRTARPIPNLPGYPSEQATFSNAAATVLAYLFLDEAFSVNAQATEATTSGLVGGIHFRFDTEAGASLGTNAGNLAIGWAKSDGAK